VIYLSLKKWFIFGGIFTLILGSVLHFIYDWSNQNHLIGIIAPVNESTWEHLKLLFWPIFLYSLIEYTFLGRIYPNYLFAKVMSVLLGMAFIITAFYTYSGIIGQHLLWMDLLIYVLSIMLTQIIGYRWTLSNKDYRNQQQFAGVILIVTIVLIILFTFRPPHIPLFQDSSSGQFGVNNLSIK
jgi:hypothetical protein